MELGQDLIPLSIQELQRMTLLTKFESENKNMGETIGAHNNCYILIINKSINRLQRRV